MNPEAINQAIAELDGLCDRLRGWYMPNYTEDLNAVARVIEKLRPDDWRKYRAKLIEGVSLDTVGVERDPIDATPLQRCEAILRATGKWVEL